jgi:hypothetical protein
MVVVERPTRTELERGLAEYRGQWVAIKNDSVVAHGATPTEVLSQLRQLGIEDAALDRVPEDPHTVFVL